MERLLEAELEGSTCTQHRTSYGPIRRTSGEVSQTERTKPEHHQGNPAKGECSRNGLETKASSKDEGVRLRKDHPQPAVDEGKYV